MAEVLSLLGRSLWRMVSSVPCAVLSSWYQPDDDTDQAEVTHHRNPVRSFGFGVFLDWSLQQKSDFGYWVVPRVASAANKLCSPRT